MVDNAFDDVGPDEDDDTCPECDGQGGFHDCGDDTCNCANAGADDDADWFVCSHCNGSGVL